MQLKTLIASLPDAHVSGSPDCDIRGIAYDSRLVKPGFLFIALRGEKVNGHDFIGGAFEQGATVVLCEESRAHAKRTVSLSKTRARQ